MDECKECCGCLDCEDDRDFWSKVSYVAEGVAVWIESFEGQCKGTDINAIHLKAGMLAFLTSDVLSALERGGEKADGRMEEASLLAERFAAIANVDTESQLTKLLAYLSAAGAILQDLASEETEPIES